MLVGWAGLLVATVAALLLQAPYGYGLGPDRLFDSAVFSAALASRVGTALSAQLMLLAITGGYLVLLCAWLGHVARQGRAVFGSLGAGLAVGLAATWAAADHAAVGVQPALALPVDVVHLLAMGLWLGGLVTLAVILRHPDSAADYPAQLGSPGLSAAIYRFSSIAADAVVILIGTGSYQSLGQPELVESRR